MKIVLYWWLTPQEVQGLIKAFGMAWMFVKYLLQHVNSLLSYKVELIFIGNVSLDLFPPYGCLSSWSWCRCASSESSTPWTNFIKKGLVLRREGVRGAEGKANTLNFLFSGGSKEFKRDRRKGEHLMCNKTQVFDQILVLLFFSFSFSIAFEGSSFLKQEVTDLSWNTYEMW